MFVPTEELKLARKKVLSKDFRTIAVSAAQRGMTILSNSCLAWRWSTQIAEGHHGGGKARYDAANIENRSNDPLPLWFRGLRVLSVKSKSAHFQPWKSRKLQNERGRRLGPPYSELVVQICSPHGHLYMRRVMPFRGSSIL